MCRTPKCPPSGPGMGYLNFKGNGFSGSRSPLSILHAHPSLGLIGARCDFAPSSLPCWGNERTFSWEPYLEKTVNNTIRSCRVVSVS